MLYKFYFQCKFYFIIMKQQAADRNATAVGSIPIGGKKYFLLIFSFRHSGTTKNKISPSGNRTYKVDKLLLYGATVRQDKNLNKKL